MNKKRQYSFEDTLLKHKKHKGLHTVDLTKPRDTFVLQNEDGKLFLTIHEDGEFQFNRKDFPEWEVDDFAREFIKVIERLTKK